MSSTRSALDTLIQKVTSAEEQLSSILVDIDEYSGSIGFPTVGFVGLVIRLTREELRSALSEAADVTTTGPLMSGRTKSTNTSTDTRDPIKESAKKKSPTSVPFRPTPGRCPACRASLTIVHADARDSAVDDDEMTEKEFDAICRRWFPKAPRWKKEKGHWVCVEGGGGDESRTRFSRT